MLIVYYSDVWHFFNNLQGLFCDVIAIRMPKCLCFSSTTRIKITYTFLLNTKVMR